MQSYPQQWNAPPAPPKSNGTRILLIVIGIIGATTVLFCGGGALLMWQGGIGDAVGCTNWISKGEYKKAIPPCRAIAEKFPQSGSAHNNLGWCLTLDGQLQEGLAESRKAVELEPARNSYDTLAMALALSGKGNEALQIETEHVFANGAVTNNAERVTLGMAYYASGRKQDAREQWKRVKRGSDVQARKLAIQLEAKYP